MIEQIREIEALSTHESTKRTTQNRVPRQKVGKVEMEEKFMLGLEIERGRNPIVETEEGMER